MIQYKTFELEFHGPEPSSSHVEINLDATFSCEGHTLTVPGFYAGSGIYKVRFLPQIAGHYVWSTTGIINAKGEEDCCSSDDYHGLVKAEDTHFLFEDGSRFLPFGTTIYAFAHQTPELIEQTLQTLKKAPFNKVRLCLFPKFYDYNRNDPAYFAFEESENNTWDVHHPCFEFWDNFEKLLNNLDQMGIQADLILFHPYDKWGFSKFTREQYRVYLDYLLRRFSSLPNIWWSLANEYDLLFDFKPDDWSFIEHFIERHDPYGHLMSCHNFLQMYDFAHSQITHCSLQSSEVVKTNKWIYKFQKPVIFDECCYEGNIAPQWGNISAFEMVNRFWQVCVRGGYCTHGETYWSPKEILWWSKGGILHGKSPERIAFLKSVMESLPGPIEPWNIGDFNIYQMDEIRSKNIPDVLDSSFVQLLMKASQEDLNAFAPIMNPCAGHCGEEAYLIYYDRQCTRTGELKLPENGKFKVDVIDVWKMTRETVLTNVQGKVSVDLPAKEGMALLATCV